MRDLVLNTAEQFSLQIEEQTVSRTIHIEQTMYVQPGALLVSLHDVVIGASLTLTVITVDN